MKTRLAFLVASVLVLFTACLLAQSGQSQHKAPQAQNPAQSTQLTHKPAQNAQPAHNPPRANQGRIPKAPTARTNPAEQRQTEHLATGHVNDMPHVNHDQWFGHEQPNDARFQLDHPFAHGRFSHSGPKYRYTVNRIDLKLHKFRFLSGFSFEVAAADWPLCEEWCWNCGDDFVIYEDSDHIGWYLLYNIHTGVYVHVQYMGK